MSLAMFRNFGSRFESTGRICQLAQKKMRRKSLFGPTRDPPSSGADGPTVQFSGTGTVVGTVPLQQDVQYSRSKR